MKKMLLTLVAASALTAAALPAAASVLTPSASAASASAASAQGWMSINDRQALSTPVSTPAPAAAA